MRERYALSSSPTSWTPRAQRLPCDESQVIGAYRLLVNVIGEDGVEDFASFRETISPETDASIVPVTLRAYAGDDLIGVTVGAYLSNLNAGFIAYSGVRRDWRRQGVYIRLHEHLVEQLTIESVSDGTPNGIEYVASELDGENWLIETYRNRWAAEALPCAYEQPQAQGLACKSMPCSGWPDRGRWGLTSFI